MLFALFERRFFLVLKYVPFGTGVRSGRICCCCIFCIRKSIWEILSVEFLVFVSRKKMKTEKNFLVEVLKTRKSQNRLTPQAGSEMKHPRAFNRTSEWKNYYKRFFDCFLAYIEERARTKVPTAEYRKRLENIIFKKPCYWISVDVEYFTEVSIKSIVEESRKLRGEWSNSHAKVFHFQTPEQLIFISKFPRLSLSPSVVALDEKTFSTRRASRTIKKIVSMYVNNKIQ